MIRCDWCGTDPIYVAYHDEEWGVPERDARALYEKIVMDGFQAGLSWITILRRREGIREAFEGFDPERIARYGARDRKRLMADPRIIRNNQKVDAAIKNAQAFLEIEESGSFTDLLWSFTGGTTKQNAWKKRAQVPAETKESIAMSKDLKKRGMGFVGPTICYAFMQAVGMVNDHVVDCYRWAPLSAPTSGARAPLSSSPASGGGGAPKGRRGRA
jgi:DNA-3-methyladenine glycosylase I